MADNANQIDFTWKGKDRRGKIIKGDIAAISEAIARAELRRQGIRIIGIKKKPKPLFSKAKSSISAKDIAVFSRQLATMLESGIPLVQSFDIVAKSNENPAMAEMLTAIKVDIEEGDTLAQSLRKRPIYFDELYCNLVEAGEHAGILESLLDKIATYKEKVETIKSKIKKALTYPIAVIVVAFIVTTIMLIFVVPVFKDLFDSFGADLPSFTLWVMGISDWMVNNWYYVVGSIIAVVYIFMYFKKRSKPFNYFLDRTLLKIPIVGMILHKSSIARFARTLATMSAAGVPLVEALESVAG
ncbi:MAG: type II secretion system F family protein, partial [Gammaproteobacteria bacterium]|nr:type II secretion system F family protein [Gammaproteobacteria bacterium]